VSIIRLPTRSPEASPASQTPPAMGGAERRRGRRPNPGKKKSRGRSGTAPLRPGPRGWLGRGGGQSVLVEPAPEWRGTTVQVCGLYPFGVGAGTPIVGVPLGRHLLTGATVCGDPISWFQRARLIRNPSMFVLGLPGLGKSKLIGRILTGLSAYGTIPLVLGDIRPDYADLIAALGGDVIPLGPGRGSLNVLDDTEAKDAARRILEAAQSPALDHDPHRRDALTKIGNELLASSKSRRATIVESLIIIQRAGPLLEREDTIIAEALDLLDRQMAGFSTAPVLGDLLKLIQSAPDSLREAAIDRGDMDRYREVTEGLEASLRGLIHGNKLGYGTFAQQTTQPMRRDRPVVFDISAIQEDQAQLRGAALMASWSAGFATVNVAQALAAAGLEPQRHYIIPMDEIHQALRTGPGVVERYDRLTRLNRGYGVGQIMCTHTMKDLEALATEEDRAKARGLVERSGMVVLGGLPSAEIPLLTQVVRISRAEQDLLAKWQEPASWDPETGEETAPPGRGNFLIKVGSRPGIPFHVQLTAPERAEHIGDTNRLWADQSRIGTLDVVAVDQLSTAVGAEQEIS
jgi:hypothetical protein